MKCRINLLLASAILCCLVGSVFAQGKLSEEAKMAALQGHGDAYADSDPRKLIKDPKVLESLKEWQGLKFGFMVHWGPNSQWGADASWSMSQEKDFGKSKLPYWKESGENIDKYREMYWSLNKTFNPVKFDANKWAELAKNAGAKYFVFTTMHHDGFCMFDSKFTDYKITGKDCPYSKNKSADITKELFNAFRAKGFKIAAYYSKPSWYNDNFWVKGRPAPTRNVNYDMAKEPERWEKFVQYTHNQINQLLSDYGKVDILWLDGGWVNPKTNNQDLRMNEIAANGRKKQPGLIVVDRTIHGEFENYITPEQQIPKQAIDYPWETNMTMGKQWSYRPIEDYKSTHVCVQNLIDVVAKGGNFVLNVGASPEGEFHPTAVKQLNEIGAWMKVNSQAIYETHSIAPYRLGKLAFTLKKNGAVNAIYLADLNESMPQSITIEGIDVSKVKTVTLLGVGKLKSFEVKNNKLIVTLPKSVTSAPPCKYAWTFVLQN